MRNRAFVLPLVKSEIGWPVDVRYSDSNASTAVPTLKVTTSSGATNATAAWASSSSSCTR
jgi:hypothetical protein